MIMKKILIASALCFSSIALFGTTADADVRPVLPVLVKPPAGWIFKQTYVKGDITVPPVSAVEYHNYATQGSLNNLQCSNITVIATSKEIKPGTAGNFGGGVPLWTKQVQATGTYSSGKCSYSMTITAGKEFYLSAGTSGDLPCLVQFVSDPSPVMTVPFGTTKVENLSIGTVMCTVIG
jgi:hypothetical protein